MIEEPLELPEVEGAMQVQGQHHVRVALSDQALQIDTALHGAEHEAGPLLALPPALAFAPHIHPRRSSSYYFRATIYFGMFCLSMCSEIQIRSESRDTASDDLWLASPLGAWMLANHEALHLMVGIGAVDWSKASAAFSLAGYYDLNGQPPSAEIAAETWWRVEAELGCSDFSLPRARIALHS